MRRSDVKRGVRAEVMRNNAGGGQQNGDGRLVVGDIIVIDRLQGDRVIYKRTRNGMDYGENYMELGDLKLVGPRVKVSPPVDVWEAARKYIR